MKSIYLAHSVHERKEGLTWQKELEDYGYEVNNPFYPKNQPRPDITKLDEGTAAAWNLRDKPTSVKIIKADLNAVKNSNIYVAVYPDGMTVGIPCEHLYAWLNKKEIYVCVPKKLTGHPWIVGLSDKVFTNVTSMMEFMKGR